MASFRGILNIQSLNASVTRHRECTVLRGAVRSLAEKLTAQPLLPYPVWELNASQSLAGLSDRKRMQENRSANSRENQNGNERSPLYIVSVQKHRGEPGHTPDESVEADASGSSHGACVAGTRQREMWGLLVFRAARSRASLCAGDLNLLAKGARFHDGR